MRVVQKKAHELAIVCVQCAANTRQVQTQKRGPTNIFIHINKYKYEMREIKFDGKTAYPQRRGKTALDTPAIST